MAESNQSQIRPTAHFENEGQMSTRQLPGAFDYGQTALPIQPEEVAFEDQGRTDLSMLKECNLNWEESDSFIATRGLIGRWNLAEIMLRAWVEPSKWKNSEQFRSHLGIPLVAEQFYGLHSAVNQTLLGGYKAFQIDPTSSTPLAAAEAQQALVEAELKTCGFKGVSIKSEMRKITYDGLFYGFGVAHYGWEKTSKEVIKRVPTTKVRTVSVNGILVEVPYDDDDDLNDQVIGVEECNQPKLEHVPIRRFRYAPDLRVGDPRAADWCGRLIYLNSYQLDSLRNQPGWNIPSRKDLVKLTTPVMLDPAGTNPLESLGSNTGNPIFQQTTTPQKAYPENYSERVQHDPLARKFEIRDYWTTSRHVVVLNKQYVLYNQPHKFKRPPFLGFCFRDAPDAAHGYGIAYWLTDFQRVCQGVINAFLDDMNLNLMGTYTAPAGTSNSAQAQWIFPGKIFKTDAGAGKIEPLTRNAVNAQEPLAVIAQMKQWASSVSGAGIGILGSNPGQSGDVRTPAGVQALAGGENIKMSDLVDVISEQVLTPFLEFCIEQNQQLKASQIRSMLSSTLGTAFKATPLDVINGTYKVTISAGTKLAAREALNKYMGVIQAMIQAPGTSEMLATQGMKLDYNAFMQALWDSYGIPYQSQIFIEMSPEDKARMAANSQAAAAQSKAAQIRLQGDVKKDVDNNQSENRMLLETGKHTLKEQGRASDQNNALELQHEKALQASPDVQGLQRAQRSIFTKADTQALS